MFSEKYKDQHVRSLTPELLHPEVISDIIRRDKEFKNTGKNRIGGSSFSSGIFKKNDTGELWIGKADQTQTEDISEAYACKEKIAGDIYAYYGANVPKMEISRQQLTNTGMDEDLENVYAIHIMSQLLPNFKTYQQAYKESKKEFHLKTSFVNNSLPDKSNYIREQGLGHVLAVASLINDVDVIGASGGNIGFHVEKNIAKTFKIDPGEAFNFDLSLQAKRCIRVALPEERKGDSQLSFDDLSEETKREFLFTLHHITKTRKSTFDGFFRRKGGHQFIVHFGRSIDELTNLLLYRQKCLLDEYKNELEATETEYQKWIQSKSNQIAEGDLVLKEEQAVLEQLFFYVTPDISLNENRVSMDVAVSEFLDNENKVMLLKGDSGSGKSLSLLNIQKIMLEKKRENPNIQTVIYIDLKRFNAETVKKSLKKTLETVYFQKEEQLKNRDVLLLMDGYDEISGGFKENLYKIQNLSTWSKLKVIITCRTQHLLDDNYKSWFIPEEIERFQECTILPFNQNQITQYLKRYVEEGNRPYSLNEYEEHIKNIPNLGGLISNPLTLRLLVEAIPEIIKLKGIINRYVVYQSFMNYWFTKQQHRLKQNVGLLENENPVSKFEEFSKDLAFDLHLLKQVEIKKENHIWEKYFSNDIESIKGRSGCPIQAKGGAYAFIHKSFLEYFSAKAILEKVLNGSNIDSSEIVQDISVLNFIRERLDVFPEEKLICYDWIEKSKVDKKVKTKSSNSITLLNAIGESFSGKDFKNVKIPGAILNYGIFDFTDFSGADLSNVMLQGAWLDNVNFNQSILTNLKLGERPSHELNSTPKYCCYSPDGMFIAILDNKKITLFNSESYNVMNVIKQSSSSIAFSPDGKTLASGGDDKTIKLWDYKTGILQNTILAHESAVTAIAFSPDGKTLASGGDDKTIKLWDPMTATWLKNIEENDDIITSLCFSPDGQKLASGNGGSLAGEDCSIASDTTNSSVNVWSLNSCKLIFTIELHSNMVQTFSFSPNGSVIATSNEGNTIKFWDSETGLLKTNLGGHSKLINSICFSPDGNNLISVSNDKTFRVWDLNISNYLGNKINGHKSEVNIIAFSPNGRIMATGSTDCTVRLWDFNSGMLQGIFIGHRGEITSLLFSPDGKKLASGSSDKTIKLWDVSSGILEKTLIGHTQEVTSLTFSSDGKKLASASGKSVIYLYKGNVNFDKSDKSIKIWDTNSGILQVNIENALGEANQELQPNEDAICCYVPNNNVKLIILEDKALVATIKDQNVLLFPLSENNKEIVEEIFNKYSYLIEYNISLGDSKWIDSYFDEDRKEWARILIFNEDRKILALGRDSNTLKLLDYFEKKSIATYNFEVPIHYISYHKLGEKDFIITTHEDGCIKALELKENCLQLKWSSPQKYLSTKNLSLMNTIGLSDINAKVFKEKGHLRENLRFNMQMSFDEESCQEKLSEEENEHLSENISFQAEKKDTCKDREIENASLDEEKNELSGSDNEEMDFKGSKVLQIEFDKKLDLSNQKQKPEIFSSIIKKEEEQIFNKSIKESHVIKNNSVKSQSNSLNHSLQKISSKEKQIVNNPSIINNHDSQKITENNHEKNLNVEMVHQNSNMFLPGYKTQKDNKQKELQEIKIEKEEENTTYNCCKKCKCVIF